MDSQKISRRILSILLLRAIVMILGMFILSYILDNTTTALAQKNLESSKSAYVITDPQFLQLFEYAVPGECGTDIAIEQKGKDLLSDGTFEIYNGSFSFWCNGSKHTWLGIVTLENGYIFTSDANNPLRFRVDTSSGYVYIGGVGTVTAPNQAPVTLPLSTSKSNFAPLPTATPTRSAQLVTTKDAQATVIVSALNLRVGPGTNYRILDVVRQGAVLDIIDEYRNCSWLQVNTTQGITGWVSGAAQYVTRTVACSKIAKRGVQTPTVTPSPTLSPTGTPAVATTEAPTTTISNLPDEQKNEPSSTSRSSEVITTDGRYESLAYNLTLPTDWQKIRDLSGETESLFESKDGSAMLIVNWERLPIDSSLLREDSSFTDEYFDRFIRQISPTAKRLSVPSRSIPGDKTTHVRYKVSDGISGGTLEYISFVAESNLYALVFALEQETDEYESLIDDVLGSFQPKKISTIASSPQHEVLAKLQLNLEFLIDSMPLEWQPQAVDVSLLSNPLQLESKVLVITMIWPSVRDEYEDMKRGWEVERQGKTNYVPSDLQGIEQFMEHVGAIWGTSFASLTRLEHPITSYRLELLARDHSSIGAITVDIQMFQDMISGDIDPEELILALHFD